MTEWKPIETAPTCDEILLYVIPKPPEECPTDTSGSAISAGLEPYIYVGYVGHWSSLSKATHWMPLPEPPK